MIISHKYKYIFLKTRKTAGTSIEISLSRFCGEDDIITPIAPKDEAIRQELGVFPQNYDNYTRPLELGEEQLKDNPNLGVVQESQLTTKFWNHIPANKIKQRIGPKIWNSYFKFCFVRNPWDRAISRYYWSFHQIKSLDESLRKYNLNVNFNTYTIDGKVAVDYIGKYESLMEDLAYACEQLGIPFDKWLPRAKGDSRKDRRHYSEVLTQEEAEYIREKCAAEIELFGYEF
ncbi:MAG: sulfotransferase family protein [Symploca sp. SIO1A3]|nr:sulfotransferase family protein [Symploca sp. SIO1A3]